MDVRAREIDFGKPAPGNGDAAPRQPGLPVAAIRNVGLAEALDRAPGDGLLLVEVSTATNMTSEAQRNLESWARTKTRNDDPILEVSLRTVRAIASSRRAVLFADEHMADAVDGLLRAINIHRGLMELESGIARRLDAQGAPDGLPDATALKLAYLRLRSALDLPDRRASVWSDRLFAELATAARLAERLDAAEDPVQHFHDAAETARQRAGDRQHFLISTVVETVIALLLLADLLLAILQ